jgi:hypothetical protein
LILKFLWTEQAYGGVDGVHVPADLSARVPAPILGTPTPGSESN